MWRSRSSRVVCTKPIIRDQRAYRWVCSAFERPDWQEDVPWIWHPVWTGLKIPKRWPLTAKSRCRSRAPVERVLGAPGRTRAAREQASAEKVATVTNIGFGKRRVRPYAG